MLATPARIKRARRARDLHGLVLALVLVRPTILAVAFVIVLLAAEDRGGPSGIHLHMLDNGPISFLGADLSLRLETLPAIQNPEILGVD